jgi:DNA polymerase
VVTVAVPDYTAWQRAVRQLLAQATPPEHIAWLAESEQASLPFSLPEISGHEDSGIRHRPLVPRAFKSLADVVACHRNPRKWDTMYRVLWRLGHDGRQVLEHELNDDVRVLKDMAAQVRRDEHKMRAFVRFAPVQEAAGVRYIAWYEPDHLVVQRAAPFFADRFASMQWSILTPDVSVHWDGRALSFTDGVPAPVARGASEIEHLWRVYYEAVFNPARLNARAMLRDMPARRWHRLPEAAVIPQLVKTARERLDRLRGTQTTDSARPFVPEIRDLDVLRDASSLCRGCRLYQTATQVVFGEGPRDADIVLVGEQPGDTEDLQGRPFIGPAGQILDRALAAAGMDRASVYVTNAVKHFSFEPRGKRRIHQTPRLSDTRACRPWLEAELQTIRPGTVVAMGSTAARALLGPQARVMALRGRVLDGLAWSRRVIVTVHPSAILRNDENSERYFDMLVSDLVLAGSERAKSDSWRTR